MSSCKKSLSLAEKQNSHLNNVVIQWWHQLFYPKSHTINGLASSMWFLTNDSKWQLALHILYIRSYNMTSPNIWEKWLWFEMTENKEGYGRSQFNGRSLPYPQVNPLHRGVEFTAPPFMSCPVLCLCFPEPCTQSSSKRIQISFSSLWLHLQYLWFVCFLSWGLWFNLYSYADV